MSRSKRVVKNESQMVDVEHQKLFVEQLAGAALGPFVSKMTFAVDDVRNSKKYPLVTITIPTNALRDMATDILASLNDPEFKEMSSKVLLEYLEEIK